MIDEVMIREVIENLADFDMVVALLSSTTNLISLLSYVLTAYSFYSIAKRRGISCAWLAWVPVIQLWVVAAISDDYQKKTKNAVTKRRKIVLWLLALEVVFVFAVLIAIGGAILGILQAGYHYYEDIWDWIALFGGIGGLILTLALAGGLQIIKKVVEYFALYDVYSSCDPSNALLFVLVNVFVAITKPIFLLISHKKDGGMPAEPENTDEE